jgi:hypothetical protein
MRNALCVVAVMLLLPISAKAQNFLTVGSVLTSYNNVSITLDADAGWSTTSDPSCPNRNETYPYGLASVSYQVTNGPSGTVPASDIKLTSAAEECSPLKTPTNQYKIQFTYADTLPGTRSVTFAATFSAGKGGSENVTNSASYSVPGATGDPSYYIVSIVYDPPGNESKNGFTDSESNGSMSSITHSFSIATNTTFGGALGFLGAQWTFGVSNGTSNEQSFQETHSSGFGSQISSTEQQIDHTQDRIYLLLNPCITIVQTGANSDIFHLATIGGAPEDILSLTVADMENPSASSDVTAECNPYTLEGFTVPGVCNICANPSACTAADFAPIVAQDLLAASGASPIPSDNGTNRYVLVGSNSIMPGTADTFMQTDSSVEAQTFTQTHSYSVGFTKGGQFTPVAGFNISLNSSTTFTWTDSQSVGTSSGTSNEAQITLGSSLATCFAGINIYEDTVYHTFIPVWSNGSAPSGCD